MIVAVSDNLIGWLILGGIVGTVAVCVIGWKAVTRPSRID